MIASDQHRSCPASPPFVQGRSRVARALSSGDIKVPAILPNGGIVALREERLTKDCKSFFLG